MWDKYLMFGVKFNIPSTAHCKQSVVMSPAGNDNVIHGKYWHYTLDYYTLEKDAYTCNESSSQSM